jgi:Fic-DOC domain mobile mystery protein B
MDDWSENPGATPVDRSGLIPTNITTLEELFDAEALNILKPIVKYLAKKTSRRSARFDLRWAFSLHGEMFGEVWSWAGKRRSSQPNIGVPVHQIETQLQSLLDDLLFWREHNTYDLVEQATRLHHRAVQIHPFNNGNGRWSRMLANIWLKREGWRPTEWPEQNIGKTSIIRQEYLDALKAADDSNYATLLELHRKYTPASTTPTRP